MGGLAKRDKHWTPDRVRERIKTGWIVQRCHSYLSDPKKYPMTTGQIRVAEMLLNRTVPTLQSVQIDISGDLNLIQSEPLQADQWAKAYTHEGTADIVAEKPTEAVSTSLVLPSKLK